MFTVTKFRRPGLLSCFILFALSNLLNAQHRGAALSFDGVDDYVQVLDDPSLDMTTEVTIAAWIRLDSYTEWASLVTKGGVPDDDGALTPNNYTVHQSGPSAASGQYGRLRFTTQFGLAGDSNSIIPLGEWHHVAVTFDGDAVRFYLDGHADGEIPFAGQLQPNSDPLHIGVDLPGSDEYWNGCVDELIISNRAIDEGEIDALKEGAEDFFSSVAGFWRFNEGKDHVAHDRSPNGNHGRLFGNPTWINFGKAALSENSSNAPGFALLPNYPNPFNPETEIRFQLPEASHIVVKIFNALGAEVRTLTAGSLQAGSHRIHWDGKDNSGRDVTSGVYLYQLRAGNVSQVRRMNLLR